MVWEGIYMRVEIINGQGDKEEIVKELYKILKNI